MESLGAVCVLENAVALCHERNTARLPNVFCVGPEVYHLVRPGIDTSGDLLATMRAASAIPTFIGIVATIPEALAGASPSSGEDLERFAGSTVLVFVGAYDGESYVLQPVDDVPLMFT
jgi:hypothetical protein